MCINIHKNNCSIEERFENRLAPVAQTLSEKLDVVFITKLFREYFKTVDHPKILVTGFSSILLNTVTHALNECFMKNYLNQYHNYSKNLKIQQWKHLSGMEFGAFHFKL